VLGSYAFGQAYYGDGPAGTGVVIPGPREIIRLQATIRRSVEVQSNIRSAVNGTATIRRRVDLEVER
jgi:hypothetical protein